MPLFSKRKSGKQNSKVAKNVAKEGTSLLPNNLQKTPEFGISQHQTFNGLPAISDSNFLQNIQRPSNSTAKCVANFPRKSRLSKSLLEILVDDSVLPLFMEYLQKQNAQNILNFWLAAETFSISCHDKTDYKSRLKTHARNPDGSGENLKNNSNINNSELGNSIGGDEDNKYNSKIDNTVVGITCKYRKTEEESQEEDFTEFQGFPSTNNQNTTAENLDENGQKFSSVKDSATTESSCFLPIINRNDNINNSKDIQLENSSAAATKNDYLENSLQAAEENEISKHRVGADSSLGKEDVSFKEIDSSSKLCQHSKSIMGDAISIYRHFISLDATQPFGVDETLRREIESNICNENGKIDPECFRTAQKFAFETLENRYFSVFIRSSYYQTHIMEILTSGKIFLADIMYNDDAVFYFMEFMEQEGKSSLLAFWFAVDSFRQELQSKLDKQQYNMDDALSDAMVLYDKYFSMQATQSLGVSDETRIRIENKICRESGPLPDCFEEPMENILTLLEEVYFPIFLESAVYFKYLSELFNSVSDVDTEPSLCADDVSSTASVCETTKLLESLEADVQEDPDEIWQRPNVGLSIGRVNEYGVYEPGIEPQPGQQQKSGASKIGQKMRKLVSGDSDKMKEEMAWQVAKMVLEDVKKQQGRVSK